MAHVEPTGQSPGWPAHTIDRNGAPFCRRSGTFAPNGPGAAGARHPPHAAFIDTVVGCSPRSTQAIICSSAGLNATAFVQCLPGVKNCTSHLDERMRALDLDVLRLLGERSRAGKRENGGNQHRADHETAARVTCRLAL